MAQRGVLSVGCSGGGCAESISTDTWTKPAPWHAQTLVSVSRHRSEKIFEVSVALVRMSVASVQQDLRSVSCTSNVTCFFGEAAISIRLYVSHDLYACPG